MIWFTFFSLGCYKEPRTTPILALLLIGIPDLEQLFLNPVSLVRIVGNAAPAFRKHSLTRKMELGVVGYFLTQEELEKFVLDYTKLVMSI
jgi:hypothetical protein